MTNDERISSLGTWSHLIQPSTKIKYCSTSFVANDFELLILMDNYASNNCRDF